MSTKRLVPGISAARHYRVLLQQAGAVREFLQAPPSDLKATWRSGDVSSGDSDDPQADDAIRGAVQGACAGFMRVFLRKESPAGFPDMTASCFAISSPQGKLGHVVVCDALLPSGHAEIAVLDFYRGDQRLPRGEPTTRFVAWVDDPNKQPD